MQEDAQKFIELLESKENWGFSVFGTEFMKEADRLSGLVLKNIRATSQVPTQKWLVFLALLPMSKSLVTLSDLSLVLPNYLKEMTSQSYKKDSPEGRARQVIIERLNVLVRRELHTEILTARRKEAINAALRYTDGNH